ncbi:hypothetical protein BGX30_011322 [Mortierella sp. GBA39]|nr:hypothetical protein BGX30_011322 [Mortierella sp. GBA39]
MNLWGHVFPRSPAIVAVFLVHGQQKLRLDNRSRVVASTGAFSMPVLVLALTDQGLVGRMLLSVELMLVVEKARAGGSPDPWL